jgi:quercetin dioxygenase-like cupin family protein
MSTMETWKTGWTAEEPLEIGYTDVPHDGGTWERGLRPHFEYRDLGLAAVTGGKLTAMHIRTVPGAGEMRSDWHCHDLDFQFFYVVKGSITIETAHGETHTLGPGDTGYHPPLYFHREYDVSPDYEVVEITAPAEADTFTGRDAPLPERAAGLDPERRPVYTFERPESYELGAGPRKFFKYRDLGTRGPTGGRIHLHLVRATGRPGDGTGWHYHSMAQWFMIVGGRGEIRVEQRPRQPLEPGDTMCIGAGPQMRHNVGPFSGDYAVLEMCVPAEYETVAVDAPEGSAD